MHRLLARSAIEDNSVRRAMDFRYASDVHGDPIDRDGGCFLSGISRHARAGAALGAGADFHVGAEDGDADTDSALPSHGCAIRSAAPGFSSDGEPLFLFSALSFVCIQ